MKAKRGLLGQGSYSLTTESEDRISPYTLNNTQPLTLSETKDDQQLTGYKTVAVLKSIAMGGIATYTSKSGQANFYRVMIIPIWLLNLIYTSPVPKANFWCCDHTCEVVDKM